MVETLQLPPRDFNQVSTIAGVQTVPADYVQISMGRRTFQTKAIAHESLSQPLIGLDLLRQFQILIDFRYMRIAFRARWHRPSSRQGDARSLGASSLDSHPATHSLNLCSTDAYMYMKGNEQETDLEVSPQPTFPLDVAAPKSWQRMFLAWLRALIWIDSASRQAARPMA